MSKDKPKKRKGEPRVGNAVLDKAEERVAQAMDALEELAMTCQSGECNIHIDCDEAPYVAAHIRVVLTDLRDHYQNYVLKPELVEARAAQP
jgi:hypothetical protein